MVDLLKAFGRGILYVILCPFFLVVLALFAVIGLLAFIFQLFKSIFYFFTGQKFFPELPEDKELRLRREAEEAARNPQPQPQPAPQARPVNNPVNNLVFEETYDENAFLEEPKEAPINRTAPQTVEQACFQEEPKPEPAPAPQPEPAPAPVFAPRMPEPEPEPEKEELLSDKDADDAPLSDFLDPFNDEPEMRDEQNEILEVYRPKGNNDYTDADDYEDSADNGVNIKFDD